jgi:hypothetical protein
MEPGAFTDKNHVPEDDEIRAALGKAAALWTDLIATLRRAHGPFEEVWRFSGAKHGWTRKLEQPKRALVYLTPCTGYLRASFALSDDAVKAVHSAGLPDDLLAELNNAKRYPEGTPLRMEVRTKKDAKLVEKIAAIRAIG